MARLLALLLSVAACSAQRLGGINMTRLCMEPQHRHLSFCQHHLVPAPSPPSCANVSIGQRVSVTFRGAGRVACRSLHSDDVIGICQEPHSGHNGYTRCERGFQTRPIFCGPSALWFVRCDRIMQQQTSTIYTTTVYPHPVYTTTYTTERPMMMFDTTTYVDHSGSCGCSWSSQHGCVVSAHQLITALTNPSLVLSACRSGAPNLECTARRSLLSTTSQYRKCLGLSPSDCNRERNFCQWAAQGSGECGIDEEGLMLQLVGKQYSQHPLVKLIMLKKKCNKYSETSCEAAYSDCAWLPSHPQAMCDVKPSKVVGMMFSLPSLVPALQRSVEEARCRTSSEAGQSCPAPMCVMDHGFCQHNPDGGALHSVDGMLTALCESSWQTTRVCPRPCLSSGGHCLAPKGSIQSPPLTHDSEHVVRVMALLMSSVWPFEQQCFKGNGGAPDMCKASSPSCTQEHFPTPGDILPHHETALGPGLKGVLKDLSSAIGADQAGEFLQNHIENNPDTLEELTKTAYDSLASFFKPAPTTPQPWTTPEMPAPAPASASVAPVDIVEASGPDPKELSPWAIAGGAVFVAAICSGVAMGVVCHARIARSQVREPLLAGSAAESEVHAPSRDREMESVPAGPGSC